MMCKHGVRMHADLSNGDEPADWSSSGVLYAVNSLLCELEPAGELGLCVAPDTTHAKTQHQLDYMQDLI